MLAENCDESINVRWFYQVRHFVNDYVYEQILRLLHQLSIDTNVTRPVVATLPLGFHPLQEIFANRHPQFCLPFFDKKRHHLVKKGLVPWCITSARLLRSLQGPMGT